ncbi:MAG: hypothetical protein LBG95_00585 [Treponema sp.]|nr:hypothetical protein [Treponema sp.]
MAQIDLSGAFMVPAKVYVGDRASLILPLTGIDSDKHDFGHILLPSPDIDIHHIAIERRPGGSFLTVEFSAYAPGILELPPINIAGETFSGLKIEISSILTSDESGMTLSAPALPLAIPGTSLMIYGSLSSAVLLMLLAIWVLFRGRGRLEGWLAALKRKRQLASMRGLERHLYRALLKGVKCRQILDTVSAEFRDFLSRFTGINYRAMTAAEIGWLINTGEGVPDNGFLGAFFNRCDGIRFSGYEINNDETLALMGDLRGFLAALGKKS